jgi:hypothetical protein
MLEGKLFGYIRVTREVVPCMRKAAWGRIINIAWGGGRQPTPTGIAVGVNNVAMINWTKSMSLQYAADGILVTAVAPGKIDTPRQIRNRVREAEIRGMTLEVLQGEGCTRYSAKACWSPGGGGERGGVPGIGVLELYNRHLCCGGWRSYARDMIANQRLETIPLSLDEQRSSSKRKLQFSQLPSAR